MIMSQFLSAVAPLSFSASSNPAALQIRTNVLYGYILSKKPMKRWDIFCGRLLWRKNLCKSSKTSMNSSNLIVLFFFSLKKRKESLWNRNIQFYHNLRMKYASEIALRISIICRSHYRHRMWNLQFPHLSY